MNKDRNNNIPQPYRKINSDALDFICDFVEARKKFNQLTVKKFCAVFGVTRQSVYDRLQKKGGEKHETAKDK